MRTEVSKVADSRRSATVEVLHSIVVISFYTRIVTSYLSTLALWHRHSPHVGFEIPALVHIDRPGRFWATCNTASHFKKENWALRWPNKTESVGKLLSVKIQILLGKALAVAKWFRLEWILLICRLMQWWMQWLPYLKCNSTKCNLQLLYRPISLKVAGF